MALELQFLNARQGDAIWIRWGTGKQIMIDMGTHATGVSIAKRFRDLPKERRQFDLLVVTHVDIDHIGGVLSCVVDRAETVPDLTFNDVWFNGWKQLGGESVTNASTHLERWVLLKVRLSRTGCAISRGMRHSAEAPSSDPILRRWTWAIG
jgi:metal-dependent hydrolase (beta-lactamase superfamily II)